MLIYISGAITNNENYQAEFQKAEQWLMLKGHTPINPARFITNFPKLTEEQIMKIDYSAIFRIGEDGVYHTGGKVFYSDLMEDLDGFHCEEKYTDGEFQIVFFGERQIILSFPVSSFGGGENGFKLARAKCGSCVLFLKNQGLNIKEIL